MKLSHEEHQLLKLHYAWPASYPKLVAWLATRNSQNFYVNNKTIQQEKLSEKLSYLSSLPLLDLLLD